MKNTYTIVEARLLGLARAGAICGLFAVACAQAQDAQQALYTKGLAATCANCHGTNGKTVQGSSVVNLAGLPKDYIIEQMKAFKSGARAATVMHQLAKGFSDTQIESMAAYFAAQKQ